MAIIDPGCRFKSIRAVVANLQILITDMMKKKIKVRINGRINGPKNVAFSSRFNDKDLKKTHKNKKNNHKIFYKIVKFVPKNPFVLVFVHL